MDGLASSEILRIVGEIQRSHLSETQRKMMFAKRYADFAENYRTLFEMACRPNLDQKKLEYMLAMREQIVRGKMTTENASKHVGQTMFDEYVKPIVGGVEDIEKCIDGSEVTVETLPEPNL